MRKQYFAPKIEIVKITSHTILAALSRTEEEANPNADVLSREFTFSYDAFEEISEEEE